MANGIFDSNVSGTPAVSATGTSGADGIDASSDSGTGVFSISQSGIGVHAVGGGARPTTPPPLPQAAIVAEGGPGTGVYATSQSGTGTGVFGSNSDNGTGVFGRSQSGVGVAAESTDAIGVSSVSHNGIAVAAQSLSGNGLVAGAGDQPIDLGSERGTGVFSISQSGIGVHAVGGGARPTTESPLPQAAIVAEGGPGTGVYATSERGTGVQGQSDTSTGVSGITESGFGVTANGGSGGVALQVIGKIEVQGNLVGSVTMAAGKKTLTVNNAAATANSLILLTPLNNPQAFLWIGARKAGSFTIDASKALPTNITIMFLIIN